MPDSYRGPEPVLTVWRNRIPHQCTLMYWGTKWRLANSGTTVKRILGIRRRHMWTAHSPVIGGETLNVDSRATPGRFHEFQVFHADGSQLTVNGPADEIPGP